MCSLHDIALRRGIEEVSRAHGTTDRLLFASSNQGVVLAPLVFDADGDGVDRIIRDANPAFGKIPGVRREKIIRRLAGGVYGLPDLTETLRNRFVRVAESGRSASLEFEMPEPERHAASSECSPGGGQVAVISRDITDRERAGHELRSRVRQQMTVAELGQRALSGLSLPALMDETVAAVARALGVDSCEILESSGDDVAMRRRAGVGWKVGVVGQTTSDDGFGSHAGDTLRSDEPVIVEDLGAETRFHGSPLLPDNGVVSGLSTIIHGRERPFGVLGVYTIRRRTFHPADIHFLQAVANVLAAAIERHRGEGELRHYARRLEDRRQIEHAILTAHPAGEIVQAALTSLRRLLLCPRACVMQYDLPARELVILAVSQDDTTGLAAGARLPLEAMGGTLDLLHGLVRKVDDLFSLGALTPVLEILKSEGVRSWISIPLIAQGDLIGSLNLGSDRPAAFTPEAVTVAHEVANQLAIVTRHARLSEEVHAGRERLLALSRRLVGAQEDERRRIARALHDETGQDLTVAMMNLQVLRNGRVDGAARSLIDDSLNLIEQTLRRVRNLSLELRPSLLDDLGLVAALRWYVDRQARRAGFDGLLVVEPAVILAPAEIETTCYRVVQEALTNVARHARASRVRVELTERAGELSLVIKDNGVGFDVGEARRDARAGTSLGLLSMEERVVLVDGVLEIDSGPGSGTVLRARFATIGAAASVGGDPVAVES